MWWPKAAVLLVTLGAAAAACGCGGKRPPGEGPATEPATEPTAEPAELSEVREPPPVLAWEGRAYLDRLLQDESRVVEVFTNETESDALDEYGRKKLREALPGWWQSVVVDTPGRPREVRVESPNAPLEGPGAPGQGARRRAITPGQAAKFFYLPMTSEMGIRVYERGSTAKAQLGVRDLGPPVATMQIFKHRGVAKLKVDDPDDERVSRAVYILESAEPVVWMERLFGGKL